MKWRGEFVTRLHIKEASLCFQRFDSVCSCDQGKIPLFVMVQVFTVNVKCFVANAKFPFNVNDKCIEFVSIGGLLPRLLPEDIRNGISQLRNRNLAGIFHRLNLIESYGTGIRRIFAQYDGLPLLYNVVINMSNRKDRRRDRFYLFPHLL